MQTCCLATRHDAVQVCFCGFLSAVLHLTVLLFLGASHRKLCVVGGVEWGLSARPPSCLILFAFTHIIFTGISAWNIFRVTSPNVKTIL